MTAPTVGATWSALPLSIWIDNVKIPTGADPGDTDADPTALAGLALEWGRQTTLDQPDPGTLVFTVLDPDGAFFGSVARVGAQVYVMLTESGAPPFLFMGRITDAVMVYDGGARVQITATDQLGDLASALIGDDPWPAETLGERIARILALLPFEILITVPARLAAIQVSAMDVDRQSALDLMRDLATSVDAVLWAEPGTGGLATGMWLEDVTERPPLLGLGVGAGGLIEIGPTASTSGVTQLGACDPLLDPIQWGQSVEDVATRVAVQWQDQTADPPAGVTIEKIDPVLEARYGVRSVSISSLVTSATAAEAVIDQVMNRLAFTGWRVGGLTWAINDPSELPDPSALGNALSLLNIRTRPGRPLVVAGLPMWTPEQSGAIAGYVEGGRYEYDGNGWILSLTLSSRQSLGESVEWGELDPAWQWQDFSPAITYASLSGVGPE